MKTISRVLASLVLVATAGVASAQTAAKDFYVEGGLASTKLSETGIAVTPVTARVTLGKNINDNLAVEGAYVFTASKDSTKIGNTNVDIGVSGYGLYLKQLLHKISVVMSTAISYSIQAQPQQTILAVVLCMGLKYLRIFTKKPLMDQ